MSVSSQGMEGNDECLGAEANEQKCEGQLCGIVHVAGDNSAQLSEVEGVGLCVEHDDTHKDAGGADAAYNQVLECGLKGTVCLVAESGEGHSCKGEDLHHDEHVEDITGQNKADNAAGEHEEEGVVLGNIVVMLHVLQGIYAGDEHCGGDEQSEEQAQCVNFQCNAYGVAAGHGSVAHPVGDYLAVEHDGLYESYDAGQGNGYCQKCQQVSHELVLSEKNYQESAEKQHHYGINGEVMVIKEISKTHPLSLLISLVSRVP